MLRSFYRAIALNPIASHQIKPPIFKSFSSSRHVNEDRQLDELASILLDIKAPRKTVDSIIPPYSNASSTVELAFIHPDSPNKPGDGETSKRYWSNITRKLKSLNTSGRYIDVLSAANKLKALNQIPHPEVYSEIFSAMLKIGSNKLHLVAPTALKIAYEIKDLKLPITFDSYNLLLQICSQSTDPTHLWLFLKYSEDLHLSKRLYDFQIKAQMNQYVHVPYGHGLVSAVELYDEYSRIEQRRKIKKNNENEDIELTRNLRHGNFLQAFLPKLISQVINYYNDSKTPLRLLKEIHDYDVDIPVHMYSELLSTGLANGDVDLIGYIYKDVVKDKGMIQLTDSLLKQILIYAGRAGDSEWALELLKRLSDLNPNNARNHHLVASVIEAYCNGTIMTSNPEEVETTILEIWGIINTFITEGSNLSITDLNSTVDLMNRIHLPINTAKKMIKHAQEHFNIKTTVLLKRAIVQHQITASSLSFVIEKTSLMVREGYFSGFGDIFDEDLCHLLLQRSIKFSGTKLVTFNLYLEMILRDFKLSESDYTSLIWVNLRGPDISGAYFFWSEMLKRNIKLSGETQRAFHRLSTKINDPRFAKINNSVNKFTRNLTELEVERIFGPLAKYPSNTSISNSSSRYEVLRYSAIEDSRTSTKLMGIITRDYTGEEKAIASKNREELRIKLQHITGDRHLNSRSRLSSHITKGNQNISYRTTNSYS